MEHQLNPIKLILEASFTVQIVMLILFLASVVSLGIIYKKSKLISKARKSADSFEKKFWAGGDLAKIYRDVSGTTKEGMAGIFNAGFSEFSKLSKQNVSPEQLIK